MRQSHMNPENAHIIPCGYIHEYVNIPYILRTYRAPFPRSEGTCGAVCCLSQLLRITKMTGFRRAVQRTVLSLLQRILYVRHLWAALCAVFNYLYHYLSGRPVSYPGDPLKNPVLRKGQWTKRDCQNQYGRGWTFACDEESHRVSQRIAPKFEMTGESAGRQIWFASKGRTTTNPNSCKADFEFDPASNPNSGDKVFRSIMLGKWEGDRPDENFVPSTAGEAATKGLSFYQMLQCEDGHWAGDYGGPMFLMPGLVCSLYITKAPFPQEKKDAMIFFLKNHQQSDGGWGTHIECASTMFGTVLSYVALRLLGEDPSTEVMQGGRKFIMNQGGALYAPSWAKFWLAVIGVYDWNGINSIPAEMWFLPRWFPLHPGKMWCHCRMVYLPMCYVYCTRFVPEVKNDPILMGLRKVCHKYYCAK